MQVLSLEITNRGERLGQVYFMAMFSSVTYKKKKKKKRNVDVQISA